MRPSFVNLPKPFIVSVITESDPDSAIAVIRNGEYDGAQAYDLHLAPLERQYLNTNDLTRVIKSTHRPVMSINYRTNWNFESNMSEDERVEQQLLAIKCGAAAVDIMGDTYDLNPMQLSMKPEIIGKQKQLIDEVHTLGGEVILSSHTWVRMSTEQVVEHMKELESRGADMVKIAAAVTSEEELVEAFQTTIALKHELTVPFIHICMGQYGKMHRFVGPMLGSSLVFCVQSYTAKGHKEQPLVRSAKAVFENLDWHVAPAETNQGVENAKKKAISPLKNSCQLSDRWHIEPIT